MSEDAVAVEAAAAVERLQKILRDIHPQAADIVTSQVAIEHEMRQILQAKLGFQIPNALKSVQVMALLRASTTNGWAPMVLDAAAAFTNLRNAVAHAHPRSEIDKMIGNLLEAFSRIDLRPDPAKMYYGTAAIFIITGLHVAFDEKAALAE